MLTPSRKHPEGLLARAPACFAQPFRSTEIIQRRGLRGNLKCTFEASAGVREPPDR